MFRSVETRFIASLGAGIIEKLDYGISIQSIGNRM